MAMNRKNYELRRFLRSMYDLQKLRIQSYNRILNIDYVIEKKDLFEERIGEEFTKIWEKSQSEKNEEKKEEKRKKVIALCIKAMVDEYKSIIDDVEKIRFTKSKSNYIVGRKGLIRDYLVFSMIRSYLHLERQEDEILMAIKYEIENYYEYTEYLSNIRGCGPVMSAIIITELDLEKAPHVSSFWKYCGLDVVIDPETEIGKARSRRKEHLVEVEYIDKNGKVATKQSITYNKNLHDKLLGVLALSFVKHGGKYRDIYDGYKHRINERDALLPEDLRHSKGHIDSMAKRYAVKMFIKDYWNWLRERNGFPPEGDWYEDKVLGRLHGESALAVNQ